MNRNRGIALIAVMVALMVLSAVALGIAAAVQTEARIDRVDFEAVQADELARSGHEFAAFLESRGLSKSPDFLAGLPFEAVTPGYHYRAQVESGAVDIYFEADSGKLNLNSAPPELIENFFALWSGDAGKAQAITAAIEDWRDPDDDVRPNGAEASTYAGLGVRPRNSSVGIADLPLILGLSAEDFQLKWLQTGTKSTLRGSLDSYISPAAGNTINPNFAPELILRAIPGLTDSQVGNLIALRSERQFDDAGDLQARLGVGPSSPVLGYLSLGRNGPAVLSIGTLISGLTRSERRVTYGFSAMNYLTGGFDLKAAVGRIERNVFRE